MQLNYRQEKNQIRITNSKLNIVKKSSILLFGMIRSGTTLLSKALSAHPKMEVASDPYLQYFKYFRNEIFLANGFKDYDKNYPISDNFLSPHTTIDKNIKKMTLDLPINNSSINEILDSIDKYCLRDSPRINPLLNTVKANNFKDLFEKLIKLVRIAYGNQDTEFVGFKSTFSEQFISPIINTYPNIKCICIIRDPRAVYASQIKELTKYYPILFIIRQWRKTLSYFLENMIMEKNVLFLRYEDFISSPKNILLKICDFIGTDYIDLMIDAKNYKDGFGNNWYQNSSYGQSRKITNKYSKKWKTILSEKEIQFIEDLCEPEMKICGYDRVTTNKIMDTCQNPIKDNEKNIYDWLLPYIEKMITNDNEMQKELIRFLIIKNSESIGNESDIYEKFLINNLINNKNQKLFI